MPDPRNVADDPAFRPGDDRAGGAWRFTGPKPDRCAYREADDDGYFACDQPAAAEIHHTIPIEGGHAFINEIWKQCSYEFMQHRSTFHCVRTEEHRGQHQYADDPDESPERLSSAIEELQRRISPEGQRMLMAELSSIAAVYKKALEAINEASRPDVVQPNNWMKIVYEVSGAALEDPPKEVDPMSFTQDFRRSVDAQPDLPTPMELVIDIEEKLDVEARITTSRVWRSRGEQKHHEQTVLELGSGDPKTVAAVYFRPGSQQVEALGILPDQRWELARDLMAVCNSVGVTVQ